MSNPTDRPTPSGPRPLSGDPLATPEDDTLDRLLALAGRRPAAPDPIEAEVRRVLHPAWQEKVQVYARRRRARNLRLLAVAAMLSLSAGLTIWHFLEPPALPAATEQVATLEVLVETVRITRDSVVAPLTLDTVVLAGSEITTDANSRAALRLADGSSVRLDADTALRLASARSLVLSRGAVYIDTGSHTAGRVLEVHTPLGKVQDIGTQFEVRLFPRALRAQVREGEVELSRGETRYRAQAGSALTLHRDGTLDRRTISAHGAAWGWILRAAPDFELEGQTLGDFLAWIHRETGLRTVFSDPALEREVATDVAYGSIAGLRPLQALEVVLTGSGLRSTIAGGTISIERVGAP